MSRREVLAGVAIGAGGLLIGMAGGAVLVGFLGEEAAAMVLGPLVVKGGWDTGAQLSQGMTGEELWSFKKLSPTQQARALGTGLFGVGSLGFLGIRFPRNWRGMKLSESNLKNIYEPKCPQVSALETTLSARYGFNKLKYSLRVLRQPGKGTCGEIRSGQSGGDVYVLTENDGRIIIGISPKFLGTVEGAATVAAHESMGHAAGFGFMGQKFPEPFAQIVELAFRIRYSLNYYN